MKKCFVALLMMGIFCLAGVASAIEFSSDVVTTTGKNVMNSKMYIKDKKIRMETQGQPSYTIVRQDKNVLWMITPSRKTYIEIKHDPAKSPKIEEKIKGEVSRKLIGSETINGHPTQKYEITVKTDKKVAKIYQWMATDIKFPVKNASVDGKWATEYKNIKMGTQSDSLFELPAGFSKQAMPMIPKGIKMPKAPRE